MLYRNIIINPAPGGLQWGLVLPLGPEEGEVQQSAFAGRAVRVSGWGPLHAVHLHVACGCMCRRMSACCPARARVHRA
eukprot:3036882-Prymnesium_polylepis.1